MPTNAQTDSYAKPFIRETLTSKSLFFTIYDVQSSMHIQRPDELQFEYTRLMMGLLLFNPRPKSILMVGLGGGSLAKFCYRYLPETQITVVEINPHVIALRKEFAVPDDDHRFTVEQGDAATFIGRTERKFDIILADGFDDTGLPEQLSSRQYYDDCRRALHSGGLIVANLHRCNKLFDIFLDRLQAAFDTPLLKVNDQGASNCVVFAINQSADPDGKLAGMRRPEYMEEDAWKELLPSMARVFLAARELERSIRADRIVHA